MRTLTPILLSIGACALPVDATDHGDTDVGDDTDLAGFDEQALDRRVAVAPRVPHPGDVVTCTFPDAATLSWQLDGVPLGDGDTVVGPDAPGSRLTCVARPEDGGPVATGWVTIAPTAAPGNVLIVILDDVGVDKIGVYGVGEDPPATPTIDRLAEDGVRFTRAWSYPTCSPTRASLQTGLYGYDTGLGKAIARDDGGHVLSRDEITIPEWIALQGPVTYGSAMIGKWHLGPDDDAFGADPVLQGYDVYRGVPDNLGPHATGTDGRPQSYFDYAWVDGATSERRTHYLTSSEADEAVAQIRALPSPWLVVLSFHAPHLPGEVPPAALYPKPHVGLLSSVADKVDAAVEALDTELARVLLETTADDTVILLGDNGTDPKAARGPYPADEAKRSIFEGGIRVPLIVRGPTVLQPGAASDALVHVVDVFATVAELAGVPTSSPTPGKQSESLLPYLADPRHPGWRDVVYTERFDPNGSGPYVEHLRAVRDDRYKLAWELDGGSQLYDLGLDWIEGDDLLAAPSIDPASQAAFDRLSAILDGATFRTTR